MQEKLTKNKGITLIALVITIIILLILAGISISSLTGSGLFGKAQDAVKLSKLKEIEEAANLAYMERQIDSITGGENATIASAISDLKEKGYTIKEVTSGANSIIGIALSEENITMERSTEKTVTYTLIYSEGTVVRYFVEVQGKDYEILFNNGNITVSVEETNIGEISKEPEVIVESSDNNIIEANKTEEGKIVLTAKKEIGDVTITVKETNSNVTKTFNVTTRIPATSLTVSKAKAKIKVGETIQLDVDLKPSNSTDKVIWSVSVPDICTVNENGEVVGRNIGEVLVIVKAGSLEDVCVVTVVHDEVIFYPNDLREFYNNDVISFEAESSNKQVYMNSNSIEFIWGTLKDGTVPSPGLLQVYMEKLCINYGLFENVEVQLFGMANNSNYSRMWALGSGKEVTLSNWYGNWSDVKLAGDGKSFVLRSKINGEKVWLGGRIWAARSNYAGNCSFNIYYMKFYN